MTSDLYYSGGYLGTLRIPAIGLSVKVYEGTDSATLAKGAGHFPDTSIWDGNCCIAGHNRGIRDDFGDLHTLEPGDTITWTTKLGTRTYEVTSVQKVKETDTSGTAAATDNRITLFTCVRGERAYRIFSDRDLEAIDLIECFKESGLTIREIRHFMSLVRLGDVTLAERLAIYQTHIARLEEKLAAVQNALDHSRRTLAFYEIAAKTGSEETAKGLYLARYGEADE